MGKKMAGRLPDAVENLERKMIYDDPETRAAFIDAIAETPIDAEPIFTMTVVDDLLVRRH